MRTRLIASMSPVERFFAQKTSENWPVPSFDCSSYASATGVWAEAFRSARTQASRSLLDEAYKIRSLAPCFELSNSSFVGDGGHDVPGWTCFVSLLRFVAELAARRRIEGEPGRRLCDEAAAEP